MMENLDWNELVDSYVDGELSESERREVEALAETDPSVRIGIEQSLKLRERLSSLRTTVPEGFAERLHGAIMASDAWETIGRSSVARAARTSESGRGVRSSRRWLLPTASAACAIAVVAFASVAGVNYLRSGGSVQNGGALADLDVEASVLNQTAEAQESRPLIMTPSPEGNLPESVSAPLSQRQLWTRATFESEKARATYTRDFERQCGRENIRFTKFGGDTEFSLQNVKPSQWQELAELLETAAADCETSAELQRWSASDDATEKTKTLRVTFGVLPVSPASAE